MCWLIEKLILKYFFKNSLLLFRLRDQMIFYKKIQSMVMMMDYWRVWRWWRWSWRRVTSCFFPLNGCTRWPHWVVLPVLTTWRWLQFKILQSTTKGGRKEKYQSQRVHGGDQGKVPRYPKQGLPTAPTVELHK